MFNLYKLRLLLYKDYIRKSIIIEVGINLYENKVAV